MLRPHDFKLCDRFGTPVPEGEEFWLQIYADYTANIEKDYDLEATSFEDKYANTDCIKDFDIISGGRGHPEMLTHEVIDGITYLKMCNRYMRPSENSINYIPEAFYDCMAELERVYSECRNDDMFWAEFRSFYPFIGRPTPLHAADRLTEAWGGARVYLKREDLCHTGSHKLNNALGQLLVAKRLGRSRIIAETGTGQHGVATAAICAKLGLQCVIYMGSRDMQRQKLNVQRIQMLGAQVVPVTSGSCALKDAVSEAMRDFVGNMETTYYLVGSAVGSHPLPTMVRDFQRVIGCETKEQMLALTGKLPDAVVACVGRGSSAIGMFHPFIADADVRLVGARAAGASIVSNEQPATAAAALGTPGVLHGARTLLLQDARGQILEPDSVASGMNYPGIGPEHAWLHSTGRAEYYSVTDLQALEGFHMLARLEGIIPALETAHAVFQAKRLAQELGTDKQIVICISSCGDKDVDRVAQLAH
ncbi:hypothetical protein LPJ53_000184 [Coemansia erecta]|uniref:Tryptophan synthase n=1 Tax=Coemansia erecta TaxID=147472 RepID=A0A9W7Y6R3_9FUNG|nr:hypothetical protein LPJ53_000184 [Coemansia erecta]